MPDRRPIPLDGPLDLRRTLAPLVARPGRPDDPARRRDAPGGRRGPPTARPRSSLGHAGDEVARRGWGPGRGRALAAVPGLLGLDADGGPIPTGHPLVGTAGHALPGRPDPADRRRAGVARPGDPRAEGHRPGGAPGAGRASIRVARRAGARAGELAAAPAAGAGDARRAPLLRLPPVRRRAAPGRRSSGGSPRARPGSRRSSTCRSTEALRPPDGRARGSGRGRPAEVGGPGARRPGRGQRRRLPPAEPRRPSRWPASRAADDARMLELLEPYRGQRARVVRLLELSGIRPPRYGPRLSPRRIESI